MPLPAGANGRSTNRSPTDSSAQWRARIMELKRMADEADEEVERACEEAGKAAKEIADSKVFRMLAPHQRDESENR